MRCMGQSRERKLEEEIRMLKKRNRLLKCEVTKYMEIEEALLEEAEEDRQERIVMKVRVHHGPAESVVNWQP